MSLIIIIIIIIMLVIAILANAAKGRTFVCLFAWCEMALSLSTNRL